MTNKSIDEFELNDNELNEINGGQGEQSLPTVNDDEPLDITSPNNTIPTPSTDYVCEAFKRKNSPYKGADSCYCCKYFNSAKNQCTKGNTPHRIVSMFNGPINPTF